MKTLKVNGHTLSGNRGLLFTEGGEYFEVSAEIFNKVMDALLSIKSIRVSENLTLTY